MLWMQASVHKPERDGQYHCWHDSMGRVVMGFKDGSWGAQPPTYWLSGDQCPHQAVDGSFDNR